jgi:uncharacterized protein
LRYLVRLDAVGVPREKLLDSVRAVARTAGVEPKNPKWTSYGALELDIFCSTRGDFDLFVAAMGPLANFEVTKDLNVAPPYKDEEGLFAEARELFNEERYWECHEVLEGIWRNKQGEDKSLLQGIILVCAAFVHHQKGEDGVAAGVLRRALAKLEYPKREYRGFDVKLLNEMATKILRTGRFEGFRV